MLAILVFLLCLSSILSFNFDTQSPIIKQIDKDVYFGFSVAQHILTETNNAYLLVGAPLDSTVFNGEVFNRSGAIYKCPVSFKTNDCEQIPVEFLSRNSDEITENKLSLDGNLKEQFKGRVFENQWLGVTVSSAGQGSFSACAHKYVHYYNFTNLDAHASYGACYRFSNSFVQEYKHVPCLVYSHSVKIFYTNNYAFCQAGTSLSVIEETSLQSSNQLDTYLSFGMPGALNSRGLVAVKTIGKNSQNDYIYKNRSYCKFDIENDEPMIDGYCPSLWEKFSYTGMSHALIRKYGANPRIILIASGAPRENLNGLVRLFTITFDSSFGPVTKLLNTKLNGAHKGSYFGFSMCSCDVNGDGLDDLIVGAPYYSKKNEPNSGSIYVYLNEKNAGFKDQYAVNFTGKARSLFGHALTCIGDIDKDGYSDFAVGAPYENAGVVYIVRGNRQADKINVSQVIKSSDLNDVQLENFGYSLSGGVDMDSNLYPDLAIGALKSNKVVLLRTRPVLKVKAFVQDKKNLNEIDQTIKNCQLEDNLYVCFKFDICFQAEKSRLSQLPLLNFTLVGDVTSEMYSRMFFKDSASNSVTKQIYVNDASPSCEPVEVLIKKDTNDFVRPLKFKVEYDFVEDRSQSKERLEHIQNIPLVHADSKIFEFEANFKKECGNDNKCQTDLELRAQFLDMILDDGNVAVLSFKERDSVTIGVELSNVRADAEPAYAAQIDVEFDQRLDFIRKTENEPSGFSCDIVAKKIVCKLTSDKQGLPFGTNKIAKFNLTFSSTRLYRYANISSQSSIVFKMEASTLSQDLDLSNNRVELLAMVKVRANLFLYGTGTPEQVFYSDRYITRGESSMQKLDQIGPIIEHTYKINNGGPFSVHNFYLIIDWPYESRLVNFDIENNLQFVAGKHLLYLIEKPTKIPNNHPINVVCTSFYVDTLKISDNKRIQKRSVLTDLPKKSPLIDQDMSRTAVIDCFSNTAYCHKINCSFSGEFGKDETISLKLTARLWNATLVEDYPNYERVFIKSHARLYLGDDVHDDKPIDNENSVATIAYSRVSIKLERKLPLSVYLISIAIGLFLLSISTIGFYMLGFFERKKFGDDKYLEESEKLKKTPY